MYILFCYVLTVIDSICKRADIYTRMTLVSNNNWSYNGKNYSNLSNGQGQYSWVQEYGRSNSYRSYRGSNNVSDGAADSYNNYSNGADTNFGARLVLEPFDD